MLVHGGASMHPPEANAAASEAMRARVWPAIPLSTRWIKPFIPPSHWGSRKRPQRHKGPAGSQPASARCGSLVSLLHCLLWLVSCHKDERSTSADDKSQVWWKHVFPAPSASRRRPVCR